MSSPARDAAYWAAKMVLYHQNPAIDEPTSRQIANDLADAIVPAAKGDVGNAAGMGVSAAFRILENLHAQAAGLADSLGMAPDQTDERSGRYDGAF